ncbi:MAG: DUF3450 domain-containing protein [Bdellovibrionales bacterium]|nr:DUF3450 domain-containing protein [Bdellovibrionales bacterium]
MNSLQKRQMLKTVRLALMALLAIVIVGFIGSFQVAHAQEQKLQETQGAQMKVDNAARKSQEKVTKVADETKTLLDEYRATLRKIDNTKIYNDQLRKLIESQKTEVVSMRKQIEEIKQTNKEIFPLMLRMISNLEEFIKLDVPFLMDERNRRLSQIKEIMDKAKVSTSEKFRRIIEAYQIENEYGRTIEAYRGLQNVDGKELTVDYLRVGRISLVYQTLDGKEQGYWDQKERKWKELSSGFRKSITLGLKMARKQSAPNLVELPVPAPEEVQVETL